MSTGVVIAPHWAHARFAQNLVNASSNRDLSIAVQEWKFDRIGYSEDGLRCHFCNTRILSYVVIENAENKNLAIMGEDCYDKLLQFLDSGRIASPLRDRRSVIKDLRSGWRKIEKQLGKVDDLTITGWFLTQDERDTETQDLANVIFMIKRLGFAPSLRDASLAVDFYRGKRRFPFKLLFDSWELSRFRHINLVPKTITLKQRDHLKRLLSRDDQLRPILCRKKEVQVWVEFVRVSADAVGASKEILEKFETDLTCEALAERNVSLHQIARPKVDKLKWLAPIRRSWVMAINEHRRPSLERFINKAPFRGDLPQHIRLLARTVNLIGFPPRMQDIDELIGSFQADLLEARARRKALKEERLREEELDRYLRICRNNADHEGFDLAKEELSHLVQLIRSDVTLSLPAVRERLESWMQQEVLPRIPSERLVILPRFLLRLNNGQIFAEKYENISFIDDAFPETTSIVGRVIRDGYRSVLIDVIEEVEPLGVVMVAFNIPSRRNIGTYIGYHNGKVVLPKLDMVFEPTSKNVVLEDRGNFYFAWEV